MHVEYVLCRLKGATYQDDRIDKLRPGAELTLRRDPSNIHDVNAIVVMGVVTSLGPEPVPLGYVTAHEAARVAPHMDQGRSFAAVYAGHLWVMILAAPMGDELKLTRFKR